MAVPTIPRKSWSCPEYRAYRNLIQRCLNPNNTYWHRYGGRGIAVCAEWRHDFAAFYLHVGPKPTPHHSIDRIDNALGYQPGNVKWSLPVEQHNNRESNRRLTYQGETKTCAEWARALGMEYQTLSVRINRSGWSVERALSEPVHVERRRKA